jgi:hypothetical protein
MADVAEILERAADLIEPKGAWTQGYHARDDEGNPVRPGDRAAVCWCMWGAIIARKTDWHDYEAAVDCLYGILPRPESAAANTMAAFNDQPGRTQSEVVQALRDAAAKARASQPAAL